MRAVDTNVVVRLLVMDDDAQFRAANTLFRNHDIFIPVTVLLEVEWVLRRGYRKSEPDIIALFRHLGGIANVTLEDAQQVAIALEMAEQGADFADALHLVRSGECDDLVTFDKVFARSAPQSVTLLTA